MHGLPQSQRPEISGIVRSTDLDVVCIGIGTFRHTLLLFTKKLDVDPSADEESKPHLQKGRDLPTLIPRLRISRKAANDWEAPHYGEFIL